MVLFHQNMLILYLKIISNTLKLFQIYFNFNNNTNHLSFLIDFLSPNIFLWHLLCPFCWLVTWPVYLIVLPCIVQVPIRTIKVILKTILLIRRFNRKVFKNQLYSTEPLYLNMIDTYFEDLIGNHLYQLWEGVV